MKKLLIAVLLALNTSGLETAFADNISDLMGVGLPAEVAVKLDAIYGTAVTVSELPATTNTIDLGSSSKTWRTLYTGTSIVNSGDTITSTAAKGFVAGEASRAANVTTATTLAAPLYLSAAGSGTDLAAFVGTGASATGGATVDFFKTRATSGAATTIVVSGDVLGTLKFLGANGTTYDPAAAIVVTSNATPGASADMPGAIDFQTSPDGSATLASVLKLDNAKLATFTGAIKSTATTIGWVVRSGANTACTTTCGAGKGCVGGYDIGTTTLVDCASALADSCFCTF